jgi:hypothetical protein
MALGLCERAGGGQTVGDLEEATPTFRLGLPCVAVEPCLGRSLALVHVVRREDTTALLVNERPTGLEPSSQGPGAMGDALVGLCPRAWSPPLPIAGRAAGGALVDSALY